MPVDWSRSTLAHLRSVYPFHTAAGFGERGVLLGSDVTGGFRGFYFDRSGIAELRPRLVNLLSPLCSISQVG